MRYRDKVAVELTIAAACSVTCLPFVPVYRIGVLDVGTIRLGQRARRRGGANALTRKEMGDGGKCSSVLSKEQEGNENSVQFVANHFFFRVSKFRGQDFGIW